MGVSALRLPLADNVRGAGRHRTRRGPPPYAARAANVRVVGGPRPRFPGFPLYIPIFSRDQDSTSFQISFGFQ